MKTGEETCRLGLEKMNEQLELDQVCEFLLDQLIASETQEGLGCDNMSMCVVRFKN